MPTNALGKKLADAQSSQRGKRKTFFRYTVSAIFVVLLSGVLTYLIVQLDFARSQLQEMKTLRSQQSLSSQQSNSDVDNIASSQIDPPQTTPVSRPAETSGADVAAFRQQLAQYESEIEPKIEELQLNNWAAEKYAELEQLKIRAVEDFAKGAYLPARASLQQAHTMITELSAEYVRRLLTLKREAYVAFENNRTPASEKAIQQALLMSPEDVEMRALQKRVTVLPQVLDLLTQATVAQHENRPEKEIVALQKILSLDPMRRLLELRLEKLQAQQKRQQFAITLGKAQRALDAGNLAAATKQIDLAKTIFPTNEALPPVQNQLQQAQIEQAFARQIALAERAKQQDKWQVAAKHFQRARQLKPNNKTAVENHKIAQQIVDITKRINRALAQEHRLADETTVNNTAAYLREVEAVVTRSTRLQKAHAELARQVMLYTTEVEVVVISDNKTDIIVRGQGQVGKTLRRTILLRPGKRVFEGACSGYKSKLVTVDIKPETSVTVIIVCDEKI